MGIRKYNKLVRDRIPEIIRENGEECVCRTLSQDEYLRMIDEKLDEELREYHEDGSVEELADLLEVIYAAAAARGANPAELESIRRDKAEKRGGFKNRILLEEVHSRN